MIWIWIWICTVYDMCIHVSLCQLTFCFSVCSAAEKNVDASTMLIVLLHKIPYLPLNSKLACSD